jgi:hypothetical protein
MTSPRVIELPRRLEPVARDTFLATAEGDGPQAVGYIANVIPLRRRDARGQHRSPTLQPPPSATAA